jgi:histidinol-phosphate aminotransferase
MSIISIAREELLRLAPYSAAEQLEDTIRLNANEVPFRNGVDHFRRPLNRYPEVRPSRLQATLAAHYGVAAERLLVTRGSSEAIDLLVRCFCRAGRDNVVTPAPTFSMYRHYARIQDAELRDVPMERGTDFSVSAPTLLASCDDRTRLVFLCSPNNPTGTVLPRATLTTILSELAGRTAVVVDEAYIEFSDEPSTLGLLQAHENLVVLRTLSKALGFAGARCGSVIAQADVIRLLDAVQAPYALATPVVECVEDALTRARLQETRSNVAKTVTERDRLVRELASLPFVRRLFPTGANFVLAVFDDADAVFERTRADRILLRRFGGDLDGCARITVGLPDENDRLLASLRTLLD